MDIPTCIKLHTDESMDSQLTGPDIGIRVLQLRTTRGWSLRQLAQRSGVSHGTINSLENGKIPQPGVLTVVKLAAGFGLQIEELVGPGWEPPQESTDGQHLLEAVPQNHIEQFADFTRGLFSMPDEDVNDFWGYATYFMRAKGVQVRERPANYDPDPRVLPDDQAGQAQEEPADEERKRA